MLIGKVPDCIELFAFFHRDIDKVDELMQDIAEQQELADEISTAISKPVGFGEEFDEVCLKFASVYNIESFRLGKTLKIIKCNR